MVEWVEAITEPILSNFGLTISNHSDAINASKSVTLISRFCCDNRVDAWPSVMGLVAKEMQHQIAEVFDRRFAFHIVIRQFMIQIGCVKLLVQGSGVASMASRQLLLHPYRGSRHPLPR